jgi:DNA-binding YbaB/EbfC family protein
MPDFSALMKQAQEMQEKLQAAQSRLAETVTEGTSGGGMVKLTLQGTGELKSVTIDPTLLTPDESEILADLLVAAHADAKKKLDVAQAELMREAAGPMAGQIPGLGF